MIQVAQILFILSVLVILHEFGHYLTAKMFKVRVEKFYLFMDAGFSLVKKKIGDTEWGIGWLPLGGYVKLSGMIDESLDAEQMSGEPQPWEFRSKPAWQRLIIMLGGIIVNIILAWFIFTVLYATVGQKYIATEKIQENGLAFGEVGQKAGFRNGDKILAVDGKFQPSFNRMTLDVLLGDKVQVERNGSILEVILTDEMKGEIISKEGKEFVGPRFSNTVIDSVVPKSMAEQAGLKK
jgi:regulator of sigma E protease